MPMHDTDPLPALSHLSVEQLRLLRSKLKAAPAPQIKAAPAADAPLPPPSAVRDGIFAPRPRPAAVCRLMCLPFAGGSASTYVGWAGLLDARVELVCIDPPGRGTRFNDAPIGNARLLAERLARDLHPWLDKPFCLFGHSNGALAAFEVARRLRDLGHEPLGFFASAKTAPARVAERSHWHVMPDEQLLAAVRAVGQDKQRFLQHGEAVALFLRALRADLALSETYRPSSAAPLASHLVTLRGTEDDCMTGPDLNAWAAEFTGRVRHCELPGAHFFIDDHPAQVLSLVNQALDAWIEPTPA
jgi:medium-chain acyl-[acyl-carrier-protein] hydrolase